MIAVGLTVAGVGVAGAAAASNRHPAGYSVTGSARSACPTPTGPGYSDPPQPAGVFDVTASKCDDPNVAAYSRVRSGDDTLARHTRGRARHRAHRSTRG